MVKYLDEIPDAPLIGHVGWDLWQAAERWQTAFAAEMVARGHGWYAEARGGVFRHIGPRGVRQGDLPSLMRISKQAVQQQVDLLQADGLVARVADPSDNRAWRIVLTDRGRAAAHDANAAKRAIEDDLRDRMGLSDFCDLQRLLALVLARWTLPSADMSESSTMHRIADR